MAKRLLIILFLFILSLPFGVVSATASNASNVSYETRVDAIATPGACVIITDHGQIVFSKGYGYENLSTQSPMVPEKTVFEWGSITKTFVWVSIMQLEEQGLLDLNRDIRDYLPEGFLKTLRYDTPITILNLMNHTSGFESTITNLRYLDGESEQSLETLLSEHQPKQIFAPGEVSAYANWNCALAAYIVERIAGTEFSDYVRAHILLPINMTRTAIRPMGDDKQQLADV